MCDTDWLLTGREAENQPPIVVKIDDKDKLIIELLQQVVNSNKASDAIMQRLERMEQQLKTNAQKLADIEMMGNEELELEESPQENGSDPLHLQ